MKKFFTILLTLCAFSFFSCDDKENKEATQNCDPACEEGAECTHNTDTDKWECVAKSTEECKCADGSDCPEGNAEACPNCSGEGCESTAEKCDPSGTPACDTECKADEEECICRDDKWQCIPVDKPAECNPACEDGVTKCECTMDACACVPVTPVEECFCDEAKTVKCPEGGKDACAAPAPTCDPTCPEGKECKCFEDNCDCADVNPCDGKSENDACGDKMICKMEAEALVCKADATEPTPSEPAPAE